MKYGPLIFIFSVMALFSMSVIPEFFQKDKRFNRNNHTSIYTATFSHNSNTLSLQPSNGDEHCIQTATLTNLNDGLEMAVFECIQ